MIIGRSLTPLNSSKTLRPVRRRETVRLSGDNSRGKVQNVREDSSAVHSSLHRDVERSSASVRLDQATRGPH